MRRFYFDHFTMARLELRISRIKTHEQMNSCLQRLCRSLFGLTDSPKEFDQLVFYTGSLLFSKKMKKAARTRQEAIQVDRVHSALYAYSHSKMEQLFEIAPLGTLFSLYQTEAKREGLEKDSVYAKNLELYLETIRQFAARFKGEISYKTNERGSPLPRTE